MNIYLLERSEERVGWDTAAGYVIIAESSDAARKIAYDNGLWGNGDWLNDNFSTCIQIGYGDGPARIVLCDFLRG